MHITLPLELHSSKNSQQIVTLRTGKRMLIKSIYARRQDKILDVLLPANKKKWEIMKQGKAYPLKVGFFLYRKTKRRWDWQNILAGLSDAMTRHGYWPDDSAFYFTPVYLGWAVDGKNPRCEVTIL